MIQIGTPSPQAKVVARTLPAASKPVVPLAVDALERKFGRKASADIARGVHFCALVWDWAQPAGFVEFCTKHYHPAGKERRRLLRRLDEALHLVRGTMTMVGMSNRLGLDLQTGELTPSEELLGAFSVATHLDQDLRTFNVAALVQLNFGTDDLTPPKTREAWAHRRMARVGRTVIPSDLSAEASKRSAEVDSFVAGFNIHLDKIDYADASVAFPKDTVRISHWGLRDYMMSLNGEKDPLPRQHAIRDLMRRVVDGEIPKEALSNPKAHWDQKANTVTEDGKTKAATPIGALRWEKFKRAYDVQRQIDPHTAFGSIIDNKFNLEREIPEEKVVQILTDILSDPAVERVGEYLSKRLGRPLEPQDIYFKAFQTGSKKAPLAFDIAKKYPNAASLEAAIPGILVRLGFKKDRAKWIGSKIQVDDSRSAGHAAPPGTVFDKARLRVRFSRKGVTEESFNIFMHELGHSVEQVLTSYEMDYKGLWSVPNTAFTEGFAFTFQDKADFILGRKAAADPDVVIMQRLWEVFEIAGPSLTEIRFFHWLYENPDATALDMQKAVRRIGDKVWADYYARIFGPEGYGLMSVYSHMLWCIFYLADYAMGYVIAYQVRKYLSTRDFAPEMERLCALGSIYPESWMKAAVGQSVSADPLLRDAEKACNRLMGST